MMRSGPVRRGWVVRVGWVWCSSPGPAFRKICFLMSMRRANTCLALNSNVLPYSFEQGEALRTRGLCRDVQCCATQLCNAAGHQQKLSGKKAATCCQHRSSGVQLGAQPSSMRSTSVRVPGAKRRQRTSRPAVSAPREVNRASPSLASSKKRKKATSALGRRRYNDSESILKRPRAWRASRRFHAESFPCACAPAAECA